MTTNLLLTGGPHPFASTTPLLVDLLADHGIATTVVTDPFEALARLGAAEAGTGPQVDLVTVHALRWRMDKERYAAERAEHAVAVDDVDLAVLDRFVRAGGGLLALHTAVICFDGAATWRELCGATWDWERSSHPPLGPVPVTATAAGRAHEVTGGVDAFTVEDEAYGFLDEADGLEPLLVADHGGRTHPLVWARTVGEGRVVTDLLGHGPPAFEHPIHRRVLARAASWAAAPAATVATVPSPAAGDAPARSHP